MAERTLLVPEGEIRPAPLISEQRIDLRTPLEVVRSGEAIDRIEQIPLSHVITETSIIDGSHASALAESMKLSTRGQLSPIIVRAREVDGEAFFDVIDGFHRSEGKKREGEETITAKVLYGCSDEEMYDQRILAVNSVKSVQFARLGVWMSESWRQAAWSDRLTVTQAFSMAVFDSQTSRFEGISQEDVEGIKGWVKSKATAWQKPVSAIWSDLRLIDISDPELVKQVRPASGGKDRQRVLTKGMLKSISERFPGCGLFHVQRALVAFAIERRLSAGETEDLLFVVASGIDTKETEGVITREIKALVESGGARDNLNGGFEIKAEPLIVPPPYEELAELEDGLEYEDPEITPLPSAAFLGKEDVDGEIGIDAAGETSSGETTDQIFIPDDGEHKRNGHGGYDHYYDHTVNYGKLSPQKLLEVVLDLDEKLRKATESVGTFGELANFWDTATYLSDQEILVFRTILGDCVSIDEAALKIKITPMRIIQLLQSGYKKRGEYIKGERFRMEEEKVS